MGLGEVSVSSASALGSRLVEGGASALELLSGAFDLVVAPLPERAQGIVTPEALACVLRPHLAYAGDPIFSDAEMLLNGELAPVVGALRKVGLGLYGHLLPPVPGGSGQDAVPRLVIDVRDLPEPTRGLVFRKLGDAVRVLDPDHFVWWDHIELGHVMGLKHELETAPNERAIHAFLVEHPVLLVQSFTAGHGRWVYPRSWLGKDHEIDFLVATQNSMGYEWTTIELEAHNESPFTKAGRPTARLNEAIDQVRSGRRGWDGT